MSLSMEDAVVVGDQVLGLAAVGSAHGCADKCRLEEEVALARARDDVGWWPGPADKRLMVRVGLRHRCGTWCRPVDSGGPVIQGRRDPATGRPLEPVTPGRLA